MANRYVVTAESRRGDWYWTGAGWARHLYDAAVFPAITAARQVALEVRPLQATDAGAARVRHVTICRHCLEPVAFVQCDCAVSRAAAAEAQARALKACTGAVAVTVRDGDVEVTR